MFKVDYAPGPGPRDPQRPFALVTSPSEDLVIINLYDICSISSQYSMDVQHCTIGLKNGKTIEFKGEEYTVEVGVFISWVIANLTSYTPTEEGEDTEK